MNILKEIAIFSYSHKKGNPERAKNLPVKYIYQVDVGYFEWKIMEHTV